jgi:transposase-like protein
LPLSEKIDGAARALAAQDQHGVISELSREFGISRPTVYAVQETASEVLEAHFEKSERLAFAYRLSAVARCHRSLNSNLDPIV